MKTATAILATLTLIAALPACGTDDPSSSQPGNPSLVNFQQSACKLTASEPVSFGPAAGGSLTAQVLGSDLSIVHKDANYNCASKLSMEGTVSGNEILVKEVITNPNELARCMCPVDLSATMKGLAAGTYLVKVTDAAGQLVGSTSVSIGASAPAPEQVNGIQSACKATPAGEYAVEGLKTSLQTGLLTIAHENARYNCASKVKLEATLQGQDIVVKEVITNPDEAAFCICDFDLSVGVKGLAAGTYTVKLYDASGNLLGTSTVTIQ